MWGMYYFLIKPIIIYVNSRVRGLLQGSWSYISKLHISNLTVALRIQEPNKAGQLCAPTGYITRHSMKLQNNLLFSVGFSNSSEKVLEPA